MPAKAKPRLRDLPDVDGPSFAAGEVPVWDGAKFGGEPRATDAALAAHEADTTAIHGIVNTAALVLTSDARLSDARTPTGAAGGVLAGTFPNPGFAQDMATQAELDAAAASAVALAPATSARNVIQPTGTAVVPLTLKGAVAQSADLQEWQTSAAAVKGSFSPAGLLHLPELTTAGGLLVGQLGLELNSVKIDATAIRHTYSTGVADSRFALVDNGTAEGLPSGNDGGAFIFGSGASRIYLSGAGFGSPHFRIFTSNDMVTPAIAMTGGGQTYFTPHYTHVAGLIAKGRASHSGPLQEWVSSADAVLASVTVAGLHKWASGNEQTTVGAAGAASVPPLTPTKYLKVVDSAGTTLVIPAYAAA